MIGASVYILACSARNRVRVRLRRLREPRYLIGAIAGAAYFYFSFFSRGRSQRAALARRRSRGLPDTPPEFAAFAAFGPAVGGMLLMVLSAAAWVFPLDSGLLDFSEAEVQMLFPAPVSRRWLVVHRLIRSQIGMLFGALVTGLVFPAASGASRLRVGVTMWLVFSIGKVYFTGVTLSRARFWSADQATRLFARLPLVAIGAAILVVGRHVYDALAQVPAGRVREVFAAVSDAVASGKAHWALWPFAAVIRPAFSEGLAPFLYALAGSAVVFAACLAWVLSNESALLDATDHAANVPTRPAKASGPQYRAGRTVWQLAPSGRPEVAFAWKAAMQTFRVVDLRILIRIAVLMILASFVAASAAQRNGVVGAFAAFALAGSGFAVLFAPQAVRIDMRQDLAKLELLKTWPLRPADVVRGEMLWPGLLITAGAWMFMTMAIALSGSLFSRADVVLRVSLGLAAIIIAPGLIFAQLAIQNAVALLFPAWVSLGSQRARGLDAMGQRLIILGGTWLALIVMMLPGAIAGGIVWFAAQYFIRSAAAVPAAAIGLVALVIEVLVLTELLGPAYERLDLLAVERVE